MTATKTGSSPSPRKRGRPSKASAPPAREALLKGALQCFAREGYERVSLRKLGAELGVSDALLIHYFESKDGLWREAVELAAGTMKQQLEATLERQQDATDPASRLIASIKLALTLSASQPDILRLAFHEESSSAERSALLRKQFLEPYLAHVDAVLRECQKQGQMSEIPFNSLHAMVIGAARLLVEPGLLGARARTLGNSAKAREAYIDGVLALLRRGLGGSA